MFLQSRSVAEGTSKCSRKNGIKGFYFVTKLLETQNARFSQNTFFMNLVKSASCLSIMPAGNVINSEENKCFSWKW